MELPTPAQARRRQNVAVAVLLGLVAAAIAVWLVVREGEEPTPSPPEATVPELPARHRAGDEGIRVDWPRSWSRTERRGVIELRSPDRAASVLIAAPAAEGRGAAVLDSELDGIKKRFRGVEVDRGSGRRVGGLDARGAVVSARRDQTPLRILVAVAEGRRHTYLVEVITAQDVASKRLVEGQLILESLRLEG